MKFSNRVDAGKQLAGALQKYANKHHVIVLALLRGGVFEVY